MNEIDSGYSMMVRKTPSKRTPRSSSTASSVPRNSVPTISSTPNRNMLPYATCQRGVANSRSYCAPPAKL